jgi:hypothetical protein
MEGRAPFQNVSVSLCISGGMGMAVAFEEAEG